MPKYEITVDTDTGEFSVSSGGKQVPAKSMRIYKYMDMDYESGKAQPRCSINIEDESKNEDGSHTYTVTRAQLTDFLAKNIKVS